MEAHHYNNIFLLLLIVSFYTILLHASATSSSPAAVGNGIVENVKLNEYYEALCPFCENFILNYLNQIFENGVISIADLKLSPYGNAQHGEMECLLNIVEACAIHAWPAVNDHFPFVYCVENLTYSQKYNGWETCFEILKLDPKPVNDCYHSDLGHELELQNAAEIQALEPPYQGVPWVVVDGEPVEDYVNLISFICKAYKGPNRSQSHQHSHREEENAKSSLSKIILATASWMHRVGGRSNVDA